MRSRSRISKAVSLFVMSALPITSTADFQPERGPAEVEELRRLLDEQERRQEAQQRVLEEQMQQLQSQQRELDALKKRLAVATMAYGSANSTGSVGLLGRASRSVDLPASLEIRSAQAGTLEALRAGQQSSATGSAQRPEQAENADQGSRKKEPEQVGERPEEQAERSDPLSVADVIRDQSILTPKGTLVLTPSVAYSNDSNVRTAITGFSILPAFVIGLFDVRKINRDTVVTSLSGRYGLTQRMDLELKVPYVYRNDSVRARPFGTGVAEDTRFSASGGDIGDVEAAIRYQFRRPSSKWPFITGGLRVKSRTGTSPYDIRIDSRSQLPEGEMPTGSGFWGVKPSLFLMYPSDPVVFFSELSYQWSIEDDLGRNVGSVDPGDFIGFDFGMGFALNEKASFTLGYQHRTVLKTEREGEEIGDTLQVASLVTSFAYKYGKNASANFSIAAGITDDSPNLQVTLSFPIAFDL